MPYKENLKKATTLKKELDGFRPLTPEMEKRIMQKFRLDWNYHSSHIEGNMLTYGETKALILFGQTAQAKPLKDHIEMTGHDEAIKYIEEVVKQERPLTETFIRELHKLILKEPYEVDAITPDGKPTKKTITIGQYKTVPNHVKTQTGEIFYFATPEETPAKMSDLMQWYTDNINNTDTSPVLFATEFHYRFIRIHPFDDGNGRIARLLMNFILMQKGYPPAIIKTEDKSNYFAALQQADAGQLDFFFNYICEQVNHSLNIMIKGANGENIEEQDDLDKELALLKQKIKNISVDEVKETRNPNTVKEVVVKTLVPLLEKLNSKLSELEKLYNNVRLSIVSDGQELSNAQWAEIFIDLQLKRPNEFRKITFSYVWRAFKKAGINAFDDFFSIVIDFDEFKFIISIEYSKMKIEKLYMTNLSDEEINDLVKQIVRDRMRYIESRLDTIKKQNSND